MTDIQDPAAAPNRSLTRRVGRGILVVLGTLLAATALVVLLNAVLMRLYSAGFARWRIKAGSEATALVAFCTTELMMFWNPEVAPFNWFCRVLLMLMFPQTRLLFQPPPTEILSMLPALPIVTAFPPPML